jgi:hypothetical protein
MRRGDYAKWDLALIPLFACYSGQPFDILVGHDLYADTLFNGRPGIATNPAKTGVIETTYGLLDPNPTLMNRYCRQIPNVSLELSCSTSAWLRHSLLATERKPTKQEEA